MHRNKKSVLNAIAAMLLILVNGIIGMVFVKYLIVIFGSDYNGLNSTSNQLMNVLMILEGGFTIATNVALFKPYSNDDYESVNAIAAATKKIFCKIGILSLAVGFVLSVGYSFFVNTNLSQPLIIYVCFLSILPICFNLYYATKYRILIQAEQKEYIISFVTLITFTISHAINIIAMHYGCSVWFVQFCIMFFSVLNSVILGIYVKKKYPFLNFNVEPNYKAIKGTKDVFAQKITGVLYSSAPIFSITLTAGGTMLASVYAVYSSVFMLVKGALHAIIDAPRLGIGEIAATGDMERIWNIFEQYEMVIAIVLFIFMSTTSALIMPFIAVYTSGITDINYYQPIIALLLALICYFELLHIPSGHMINMTGNFKISRNFQIIAAFILMIGIGMSFIFNIGVYGILGTVLVTALSLCVMEIGFIHTKYFKNKIMSFLKFNIPFALASLVVIFLEIKLLPSINSYVSFGMFTVIIFVSNVILGCAISFVCDRKATVGIYNRLVVKVLKRA